MAEEMSWQKIAVLQIINELMKNPLLLSDRKYRLSTEDFPEQFHKIVFGAIEHLAFNGAQNITPIDVDQFLVPYSSQYKVFCENNGMDYLTRANSDLKVGNFEYYYEVLKKYSLLNRIKKEGFDTKDIYDTDITDPVLNTKQQNRFNDMSIQDMLNIYEGKLASLKQDFGSGEGVVEEKAGENIFELIEKFKEAPEMGLGMISPKMTTIFRGRRLKKLYLESSAQGMGKSRRACGESCRIAVPWYYDTKKKEWLDTGMRESVLLISTELEADECKTMWLAYISGVPEDHILDYKYTGDEKERVELAAKYLNESNLYFCQITNFNVDDIENIIKKYHCVNKVNYIFYDYLSTSVKIMAETSAKTKISGLREDQILLMFADRLKTLCNNLGVHIQTATQLNGEWKNAKEADQNLLRGAKSISDKIDNGAIMLPLREGDEEIVDSYLSKGFETRPNMVIHIYKVRRGSYNNVRLYVYFDKATCRLEDCFIADKDGNIVNVEDTTVELLLDNTKTQEEPEIAKYGFSF